MCMITSTTDDTVITEAIKDQTVTRVSSFGDGKYVALTLSNGTVLSLDSPRVYPQEAEGFFRGSSPEGFFRGSSPELKSVELPERELVEA